MGTCPAAVVVRDTWPQTGYQPGSLPPMGPEGRVTVWVCAADVMAS